MDNLPKWYNTPSTSAITSLRLFGHLMLRVVLPRQAADSNPTPIGKSIGKSTELLGLTNRLVSRTLSGHSPADE